MSLQDQSLVSSFTRLDLARGEKMSLFLSSETDESMVTCETGDYVYSDISHSNGAIS